MIDHPADLMRGRHARVRVRAGAACACNGLNVQNNEQTDRSSIRRARRQWHENDVSSKSIAELIAAHHAR